MINKQSIWFLTLLTLVLVLGVYYVTMPNDLLKSKETLLNTSKNIDDDTILEESDMLVALRVERNEELASKMESLQEKLTSNEITSDEKNKAFDELQTLNITKGQEQTLEEKINNAHKIKCYVEINDNNIKIVVSSKDHNATLANDIMRTAQSEFKEKMYITVKFEN